MAHFQKPPRNVRVDFVRVFVGQNVDLQLWGGGAGGEELVISVNDPSVASLQAPPRPAGANLRSFRINGIRVGNVMLEARNRAGHVWAYTQIIVFQRVPLRLSDNGLRFIAAHEGWVGNLYNDAAGHCTIGYGHLVHRGNCNGTEPAEFRARVGITQERGRQLLRADVAVAEAAVNRLVTVPLYQHEFDALVSFTFNLGEGALRQSALLRNLNDGQYDTVPAEMNRFVNAGGQRLPGLVTRRNDEGALFRDD